MIEKYQLAFLLLYGCGLRKAELLKLRVKDIDFNGKSVFVVRGKGGKDRVTVLPNNLHEALKKEINAIAVIHQRDLAEGGGETSLPPGLARKYPYAIKESK